MEQRNHTPHDTGITRLTVGGFKSIRDETSVEIRPLTLLAGANSSGKSSIVQPLLMMKQTLEAPYDPGALLLDGPNVKFTRVEQFLNTGELGKEVTIKVYVEIDSYFKLGSVFQHKRKGGLEISETLYQHGSFALTVNDKVTRKEQRAILEAVVPLFNTAGISDRQLMNVLRSRLKNIPPNSVVLRNRCFWEFSPASALYIINGTLQGNVPDLIIEIIHIAGSRGKPERTYPLTSAIGPHFPGTFEAYAASVINHWQNQKDAKLNQLGDYLEMLGLSWRVSTTPLDDTQVEVQVGRPGKKGSAKADMVSIADVGFGVSQILPVLVALLVAKPGQFVYIEQPELHLHPRAQMHLAPILAEAAQRGVRVVVETHSSLLLTGVQTLVAQGGVDPELVALHWFALNEEGHTVIQSPQIDEFGAYGEWPDGFGNFDSVILESQRLYLDAVAEREFGA